MRDPKPDQVPSRTGAGGAPPDPMSRILLSAVDGRASFAEIADASGIAVELVCRIAAALRRDGLIGVGDRAQPAAPAAPDREAPDPGRKERGGSPAAAEAADAAALATEVEAFEREIGGRNYYEILSVDPGADRAAMRRSYFELSKKFHPDRAFGPRGAELRRRMEAIFTLLTRAYETLSDAEERRQYDAYIADQIELWRIERQLLTAAESVRTPEAPGRRPPTPARGSAARVTRPAARHPAGRGGAVSSKPPEQRRPGGGSVPTLDPEKAEERRQSWRRERAERTLGSILTQAPAARHRPTARDVDKRLEQAAMAMENDRYSDAVRLLQEALAVDGANQRALELLGQAETGALHELSSGYVRQARYELHQGNAELAIAHFEKAIAVNAENIDARHQLAEVLYERRLDLPRALKLCREVIGLGGQRAKYFATLGEILLLSKDRLHAAEAFERALRIEPDNKEIVKKLKQCRG